MSFSRFGKFYTVIFLKYYFYSVFLYSLLNANNLCICSFDGTHKSCKLSLLPFSFIFFSNCTLSKNLSEFTDSFFYLITSAVAVLY